MRDLMRMRERFLRDETPVRLGNMASSLLRLSKWVQMKERDESVIDLMREIAWFMEWSGDLASVELADMQREICRWRRAWPMEALRSVLSFKTLQMSNRILELSGLLEDGAPKKLSNSHRRAKESPL
jgi:hypothetical protein